MPSFFRIAPSVPAALLLGACLFLPACGLSAAQRAAVVKFGSAAGDLGAIAAEEFRQSRLDVIAMNTRRRALGDATVDPQTLDAYFTLEDVAARVQGAMALQRYGALLAQLAGGADESQVQAAGDRLVASLGRLKAAGRIDISDEKLGAIGRAVAGVGGLAAESMRARAVREVSASAGPAVRRIVRLIRQDFQPDGEHWSLGYRGAITKLDERVEHVRADLGEPRPGELADHAAIGALLAEAEAMSAQNSTRLAEVGERIVAAADAMLLAEKDLRMQLVAPGAEMDDLDTFADRVSELLWTYRLLSE